MPYPKQAPIVFVIKSFISVAPKPNIWIISTDSETRKPAKAIFPSVSYFSYNTGRKNPIGTNKSMFRTVSTGPLIISTKGIKENLGEKDALMQIPVTVNKPMR